MSIRAYITTEYIVPYYNDPPLDADKFQEVVDTLIDNECEDHWYSEGIRLKNSSYELDKDTIKDALTNCNGLTAEHKNILNKLLEIGDSAKAYVRVDLF